MHTPGIEFAIIVNLAQGSRCLWLARSGALFTLEFMSVTKDWVVQTCLVLVLMVAKWWGDFL